MDVKTANLGRLLSRALPLTRSIARTGGSLASNLGTAAARIPPQVGAAASAVRQGATAAGQFGAKQLRFAGGLPESGPITPTQLGRAAGKVIVNPSYPGLDRHASQRNVFHRLWRGAPTQARPLDQSRQFAADALRIGSNVATGGSIAAGAYDATWEPRRAGWAVGSHELVPLQMQEALGEAAEQHAPGFIRNLAAAATTATPSPLGKVHLDVLQNAWLPQWRHNVHKVRARNPVSMGLLDLVRSVKPIGLATTAGIRQFASPQKPNHEQVWQQAIDEHTRNVPIDELAKDPFTQWYRDAAMTAAQRYSQRVNPANVGNHTGWLIGRAVGRAQNSARTPAAREVEL